MIASHDWLKIPNRRRRALLVVPAVAAAAPEADEPPAEALLPAAALLVAGALLGAAALLVAGALLGALLDELLDELHAARAARPAAAAGTTSSARRRRLVIFSLSCDVVMFSPVSPWLSAFLPTLRRALSLVRNEADEPALQLTVRVAWGRPTRRERRPLRGANRYARDSAGVPSHR